MTHAFYVRWSCIPPEVPPSFRSRFDRHASPFYDRVNEGPLLCLHFQDALPSPTPNKSDRTRGSGFSTSAPSLLERLNLPTPTRLPEAVVALPIYPLHHCSTRPLIQMSDSPSSVLGRGRPYPVG